MSMWRACSTCKKPIALGDTYFVCSVSTCQRPATNFAFCAVDCWDAHVPTFRHKDCWAEERKAPTTAPVAEDARAASVATPVATTSVVSPRAPSPSSSATGKPQAANASTDADVLIVASKLKAYIAAKSGMNTSAAVMDKLSDIVRRLADQAIEKAGREGRKTVLDRDF